MSTTLCSTIDCSAVVSSQSCRSNTLVSAIGDSQSHCNSLLSVANSLKNSVFESSNISHPHELNELNENVKDLKAAESIEKTPKTPVTEKLKAIPPFLHHSLCKEVSNEDQAKRSTMEWMTQMCHFVVRDLEKYGICVVDNFLGRERAEALHSSVVSMYNSGVFVDGETVSSSLETTRNIRGDKITWVDGTEKTSTNIAYLISTVDAVIMNSIRMKGNGQLGQREISGRTKVYLGFFLLQSFIFFLRLCILYRQWSHATPEMELIT